jgi:SAM-dependent methyltransferase
MELLLEATYRAEASHFWFRGFRRFVRPLVERAAPATSEALILDCGCGTGVNLTWLAQLGRTIGIDLTPIGLQYAQGRGERRLARASVTSLPFGDERFDLVTSFDVLVCLEEGDDARAAAEMFRVLRPTGAAVINVAALTILRGNHSVLAEERRRYTRRKLRRLLVDAGFHIERLTYTNATLLPLLLPIRLAHRLVGLAPARSAGREMQVPSPPANAILTAMLALEAKALTYIDLPVGSSLLCLARKPADGGPSRPGSPK